MLCMEMALQSMQAQYKGKAPAFLVVDLMFALACGAKTDPYRAQCIANHFACPIGEGTTCCHTRRVMVCRLSAQSPGGAGANRCNLTFNKQAFTRLPEKSESQPMAISQAYHKLCGLLSWAKHDLLTNEVRRLRHPQAMAAWTISLEHWVSQTICSLRIRAWLQDCPKSRSWQALCRVSMMKPGAGNMSN